MPAMRKQLFVKITKLLKPYECKKNTYEQFIAIKHNVNKIEMHKGSPQSIRRLVIVGL